MLSGLISAVEPLVSMRAIAVFCVSMRSSEKSAFEGEAGFLFTNTPMPLLRNMAAETPSSAHRETGRIAIIGRHTTFRHLYKSMRPTTFRINGLLHSLTCGYGRGYWLAWSQGERWCRSDVRS